MAVLNIPYMVRFFCMKPEEWTALKREPVSLEAMSCGSVDRPRPVQGHLLRRGRVVAWWQIEVYSWGSWVLEFNKTAPVILRMVHQTF